MSRTAARNRHHAKADAPAGASAGRGDPSARGAGRDEVIASIVEHVSALDLTTLTRLEQVLSARREARRVLRGSGLGDILSAAEANVAVDAATTDDETRDWAASELLGAGEIAAKLDIAAATLANWRQAGRVIAFRKGPRNFRYPARQFDRLGPIEGLDQVLAQFATSEDAWAWLVTPNRHTGSKAPLDRLKEKHLAEVARAAAGALDFG